jgi:hypothetical protein
VSIKKANKLKAFPKLFSFWESTPGFNRKSALYTAFSEAVPKTTLEPEVRILGKDQYRHFIPSKNAPFVLDSFLWKELL